MLSARRSPPSSSITVTRSPASATRCKPCADIASPMSLPIPAQPTSPSHVDFADLKREAVAAGLNDPWPDAARRVPAQARLGSAPRASASARHAHPSRSHRLWRRAARRSEADGRVVQGARAYERRASTAATFRSSAFRPILNRPAMVTPDRAMFCASTLESCDGIRHGFFTRRGGVSKGIYGSLNCGLGSRDDAEAVRQNRALVAETLGVAARPAAHALPNPQRHGGDRRQALGWHSRGG